MKPAAILFDLDDTLADRAAGLRNYASFFADDFGNALGPCTSEEVHAAILAADDFGSLTQAQTLAASALWRRPPKPSDLQAHWAARFGAAATAFPGAIEVLRIVRDRGVKLGIVTNGGSEMQRSKIAALGVEPFLGVIIVSSEVGLYKPDPAIFQLALTKLGCEAEHAWFVGDHPELDVGGSASAGMRAFWVKTGAVRAERAHGLHLNCLAELIPYLNESQAMGAC